MINRRDFLGITVGAGASIALAPEVLRALQRAQPPSGKLIQRAIPSTGELLSAVGLSFSNHAACADPVALKAVLRAFAERGGRVFDAQHGNGPSEEFHATVAQELGITDSLFWSTRGTAPGGGGGPPKPGPEAVNTHVDTLLARLRTKKLDLAMLPPQGDASHLAALKEEKKAGRVRYIGVQVIGDNVYPQLEAVMRNEPIDFIGVDYDIANRARVESTILPLAMERKIAVMAFFPFGNNGGVSCGSGSNLFGRVGNRPLPEWAAEFDATTWAHFFLKYVISHPAVTVARVGTTKASHMLDNMGGGVGRLPSQAMRERMAALVDALPSVAVAGPPQSANGSATPPVPTVAVLDRYVGQYKDAAGSTLQFRRYGTMLTMKAGSNPESVILAHSDTRFSLGRNFIEFQLEGAGTVTGLVFEAGGQKIPATRIR